MQVDEDIYFFSSSSKENEEGETRIRREEKRMGRSKTEDFFSKEDATLQAVVDGN